MARKPWGHTSSHCCYCGKVGPRSWTTYAGRVAKAHKRCIPKEPKPVKRPAPGE